MHDDLELLISRAEYYNKNKRSVFFSKAFNSYLKDSHDSTYFYSTKVLNTLDGEKNEKIDILLYMQGNAVIPKKLYRKALQSISKISDTSKFYPLKEFKLGRIYLGLQEYDKALEHYKKWESFTNIPKSYLKKYAYHNMGLCYIHKKEYGMAKEYFAKELALVQKKDTAQLIRTKIELANVYYHQYLDAEAIPLFKESYRSAAQFSDIELKQFTTLNMAVVERNRENYKESVRYYREYNKWKDSIWNRDKIWQTVEAEKQIALAQKQKELLVQQEAIKRQEVVQNSLVAGLFGLVLFLGAMGYYYQKIKRQNALISQQKEALSAANKTKDYLFAVVSHDLRSPMNSIKLQQETVQEHIASKDLAAIQTANEKAMAVANSTSHLLNNVLHWSLEQSDQLFFNPIACSLQPIVTHVVYDYIPLLEAKGIRLEQNLLDLKVLVDRESIKTILRNLLDNAIKYAENAETIRITTAAKAKTEALLTIQDTGIGMNDAQVAKLNTLQDLSEDKINRSQGLGLGIVLCQTLVKKNHGTLHFASAINQGTTVTITLPRVEEA